MSVSGPSGTLPDVRGESGMRSLADISKLDRTLVDRHRSAGVHWP
jgi:hypothetical protein